MFYIVETKEQKKHLESYDLSQCFVEPILYNDNCHPGLSNICLFFIKPLKSKRGFIIPINHSEGFSTTVEEVLSILEEKCDRIFVYDLKRVCQHLPITKPIYCLKTAKYLETGEVLDLHKHNTTAHKFLSERQYANKLIPICKHAEKYNAFIKSNSKLLKSNVFETSYYKFYNNHVNRIFSKLEWTGVKIDEDALAKHFTLDDKNMSVYESKLYLHYNLFTATGRPSNAFNGINLGALPKGDNSRAFIKPGNSVLVEFDYDSYHPRILANLINYSFEEEDIHSHLGRMYFDVEELTPEQYSASKSLTFKLLYTSSQEYEHIEFFKKVKDYKEKLWIDYKSKGYLEAILSKRPIKNIESKTQILPYLLQNYETERNVVVMNSINQLLHDKASRFIMYTFDSFLFDIDAGEGKGLIKKIKELLNTEGFTVSTKFGEDYANLEEI